jgi:hypothetical protein
MNTRPIATVTRLGDQDDTGMLRGIVSASIRTAAHGRPIAITLWQQPSVGTRIESVMYGLTDRIEVGLLSATRVSAPFDDESFVTVPSEFHEDFVQTKLFIEVEAHRLESGVVLSARGGSELLILAGAYPYSLAIAGLGDVPHRFEPEYPLVSYERRRID